MIQRSLSLLSGIGLGASWMYYADPDLGRRRRAQARDQLIHLLHRTDNAIGVVARDVTHRAEGVYAQLASLCTFRKPSDEVLAERVRSKLGRLVSHPRALEVTAHDGRVTLSGPILAQEVDHLLCGVSYVPGVAEVENRLEIHGTPDNVAALQGGRERPGERPELLQTVWSPAARLLVGAAGGGLIAYGATRKAPTACVLGTLGLGLVARGLTNRPLATLLGLDRKIGLLDIHKTIHVAAPVERVFDFWSHYESFQHFMAHVREVKTEASTGRSHWVVAGPAGVPIHWDTEVTQFVPNECVAWKTVPGSPVVHHGSVRFQPADGGTCLDIHLSYNPPAGALGHAVATLFGSDPKRALDEDLLRFKSLIELGKTSAPGKRVTSKDLAGAF
jgi:uncharacterized membrane protein